MDDNLLIDILRAADKHPNSKVSKLIRTIEEDPSQKNIVLLLIELSDHAEYATDFNISLRYYLDLFERLGINRDLMLNEAGLMLINSSKIYSKRVDYVQSLVERQILTLSNADQEIQQQKEQNQQESTAAESAKPAEKPKRGRKRALDAPTDPYEVQLEPKKFKKMTQEKRFAPIKAPTKTKSLLRNIEVEQQIHPATYAHATIYDLENEEEVDTKRNYKLFTYHIEHRYNTLVPDINFRLHFKVKDYIDAQEEADEEMDADGYGKNQDWPPLSEEYVQRYINLENHVLQLEIDPTKSWNSPQKLNKVPLVSVRNADEVDNSLETSLQNLNTTNIANDHSSVNDSGMGTSLLESSINTTTQFDSTCNESALNNTTLAEHEVDKSIDSTQIQGSESANTTQIQGNDSALGESLLDQTNISNETNTELNITLETSAQAEETTVNLKNGIISMSTENGDGNANTETKDTSETKEGESKESENAENSKPETNESIALVTENETSPPVECSVGAEATTPEISGSVELVVEKEASDAACSSENKVSGDGTTENNPDSVMAISETNTNGETISGQNENNISAGTAATPDGSDKNKVAGEEGDQQTNVENGLDPPLTVLAENSAPTNEDSTKSKDGFIELEIHVMNDNEKEPSERLQVKIPTTDDEGVHLSEAYEDDFQLLSPTIKLPNIMPGITNKDVTIFLDDELRQALEMRDGLMENFSQETYKVPVIEEPKQQPLVFNILQLPPKILRRKVLFKLGPEMDLFLKARALKPSRPEPAPKKYRISKQMQMFGLNNTDMSGIIDTPPNSPGHYSEFCGFTDDESHLDDDTICTEFCGFNEDEQNALVISPHRLSRDSGVGVEAILLTPEKEPLATIFEEIPQNSLNGVSRELYKETTEELLNDLPDIIRNALEAEIQDEPSEKVKDSVEGNSIEQETTPSMVNVSGECDQKSPVENAEANLQDSVQIPSNDAVDGEIKNTDLPENNANTEAIAENATEGSAGEIRNVDLSENANAEIGPSTSDLTGSGEGKGEKTDHNIEAATIPGKDNSIEGQSLVENQPVDERTAVENKIAEEGDSRTEQNTSVLELTGDGEDSQEEDDALFDLNLQGTKTKIQKWHEHLRPILAKSRERHHFDVFHLGSEIIDTIQTTDHDKRTDDLLADATFDDVMNKKDKSYVSRYFLSTLLLANQSNINIKVENKSSDSPSSWSDIKLKLLSTKRHTVAIEDNIGMISNKKRKTKSPPPSEDLQQISKKKIKSTKTTNIEEEEQDDSDFYEPLVKLQNSRPKTKASPTKRPTNCGITKVQEEQEEDDDDEPLAKLRTSRHKSQESPTKRAANCDIPNAEGKKFKGASSTPQAVNTKESLIHSQQILSPLTDIHRLQEMPSTSWQAKQNTGNYEVNLNNMRVLLQPIEKVPRQGDDYDSGIFSLGEMSTS